MTWAYDPDHSSVGFEAPYMGVLTIKGRFTRVEVALDLDDADPTRTSVEAVMDATSLASDLERRDRRLQEDYLEVDRYPKIRFRSRAIERKGSNRFALIGDLTIHGVTREVSFDTVFHGEATDARGNVRRGLTARATVSRLDFDVPSKPVAGMEDVGEAVSIVLEVSLKRVD